jgi:hypothetical protein
MVVISVLDDKSVRCHYKKYGYEIFPQSELKGETTTTKIIPITHHKLALKVQFCLFDVSTRTISGVTDRVEM